VNKRMAGMGRLGAALLILALSGLSATGQEPGWHYSHLPGEGDRASMGCARDSTPDDYACLAVRCEDDHSVGVYVHSTRSGGDAGRWEMTVDRENRIAPAEPSAAPYGARFSADSDWLLDRLRHAGFVYLRHSGDTQAPFRVIPLRGSMRAITEAVAFCAPRAFQLHPRLTLPTNRPSGRCRGYTWSRA